jgi:hypothetical protein
MLIGLILLYPSVLIHAIELKGDVEFGFEMLEGDTSYEIGGLIAIPGQRDTRVHFPFSKLQFPLTSTLASARIGLTVEDALMLSVGGKASLDSLTGNTIFTRGDRTVEDWDWGYWWLGDHTWARRDTLDIYSTSHGDVNVRMWDVSVRTIFSLKNQAGKLGFDDAQLRLGIGYMDQWFDYDAVTDLDQWYPSYPLYKSDIENDPTISPGLKEAVKGHSYSSGNVLTYHVEYTWPFLEGGIMLKLRERFLLEARLGYSYWVTAHDNDHHLLRDKVSKGDCDGTARLYYLNTAYNMTKAISLGLHYNYIAIDTTGSQQQYAQDYSATVDQHIESSQEYLGLYVGYAF